MTWAWGEESLRQRDSLHPDLQRLFDAVLARSPIDLACREGWRGKLEQDAHYDAGRSTLRYPESKHNRLPSWAGHLIPLGPGDDRRYYAIAGIVWAVADELGMRDRLRWGGDWDRDYDVMDETFLDLAHWELTAEGVQTPEEVNAMGDILTKALGPDWLTSHGTKLVILLALVPELRDFLATPEITAIWPDAVKWLDRVWQPIVGLLGYFGIRRAVKAAPAAAAGLVAALVVGTALIAPRPAMADAGDVAREVASAAFVPFEIAFGLVHGFVGMAESVVWETRHALGGEPRVFVGHIVSDSGVELEIVADGE